MTHDRRPSASRPIRIALLGAGARGSSLCEHILRIPHRATLVAVAEPVAARRERIAQRHGIPAAGQFEAWQDLLSGPARADAVIVATMDHEHALPAIAALEQGYHLLLEKPMAPTLNAIADIALATGSAQERHGTVAGVVHPLRYGPSFQALREIVASGRIGTLVTLDHIEQVGWWHYAHSYVRGNWRRSDESAFMLLTKSCHDIDYLSYLVGEPVLRVSSFGSLSHFRREHAPARSGDRCTECPIEPECEYSALRWYVGADREHWPASVASDDHSLEAHLAAVSQGPFGRCVWQCDNDVVDHQVVSLEFETGITATFTMTAFTSRVARRARLHGTRGDIDFRQDRIEVREFAGDTTETTLFANGGEGHGDGDYHIIERFVRAVETGNQTLITTSIPESVSSHVLTFAAEHARLTRSVVDVTRFAAENGVALP